MRGPELRTRLEFAGASLSPFIYASLLVALTTAGVPAPRTPVDSQSQSPDSTAWSHAGGGVAKIEYNLPKAGRTRVLVFDAAGREVARPVDEWQSAGVHHTMFAFGPRPNQVFVYRVECGKRRTTGKISTGP